MFISVGVAVVVIVAAVAFFAFMGGDDGGEPSAHPSKVPSVSSSAEARNLAKRVALTPKDWGDSFVRDSPYENTGQYWPVVDQDCKVALQPLAAALDTLYRNAKEPDETVFAQSSVMTYKGSDSAKRAVAQRREPLQRCPTQNLAGSKARLDNVHEVDVPNLKGFDDLVAEEGHDSVDSDGQKVDSNYTFLTASKGQFVLQAYVSRGGSDTQEQTLDDAVNGLSLMLSRLESG
ncbi:hypothetical protein ACGFOU_05575 [Streptomyces sp. NPDC048595]|uniref:hypothetical protein n=1 Tax=Streptomyces sp. NPDC048595 TaxID=3365576 RepID=UPI003717571D